MDVLDFSLDSRVCPKFCLPLSKSDHLLAPSNSCALGADMMPFAKQLVFLFSQDLTGTGGF